MLESSSTLHNAHIPVLLSETLEALAPKDGGRYLDGTLGLGGHAHALLQAAKQIELCALDRDKSALEKAQTRLRDFAGQVHFFHSRYSHFQEALDSLGWAEIDGALVDIGLSSMQIDVAERGFSFNADGPLDMRMDMGQEVNGCITASAWHLVNRERFETLKDIIQRFGEDPQAGRIARHIVDARQKKSIDTTQELANIVSNAYPAAWRAKSRNHPATRTFQALRMAVNEELLELENFLQAILGRLRVGGRLVVISFHSLEDRMVKQSMRYWAEGCRCPRHVPRCVCGHKPEVRILYKKPLIASQEELFKNPRASSAKLRAVEKI